MLVSGALWRSHQCIPACLKWICYYQWLLSNINKFKSLPTIGFGLYWGCLEAEITKLHLGKFSRPKWIRSCPRILVQPQVSLSSKILLGTTLLDPHPVVWLWSKLYMTCDNVGNVRSPKCCKIWKEYIIIDLVLTVGVILWTLKLGYWEALPTYPFPWREQSRYRVQTKQRLLW